ncbi:tetraacyldisaccharide 4'-kinase [Caldimonas sp. KR1-144]|uniref:tetraacyldisaccharide 4'-kinase n=1 Tax=Caldimonas sp. KR1-144 TaxID=3400911 RepID=UPI003BFFE00A
MPTARAWLEAALQRTWARRGPPALALLPLSWLYGWLAARRRAAFADGRRPVARLDVPVIVVGNRIAGGAGKTPTVLAVVAHLRARGWRAGVISRGHGGRGDAARLVTPASDAAEVGDEPLLIRLRSGAPVAVGRDRVAAAHALRAAHPEVDIIVSDDGGQHLALGRDVELWVWDARGAGNGWLLPAGPLREPIDAAPRSPAQLVLYNAERASTPLPGFLARRRLRGLVALAAWWQAGQADASALVALADPAAAARQVWALAGIARPQGFFELLSAHGLRFTPMPLPDHATFDVLPWPATVTDLLVTEKDAVKLRPERIARERPATRVWVAPLDYAPDPALWVALDAAIGAPPGRLP